MKFVYDYSFEPDSSTIKKVYYDYQNKTLAVEFKHGGFAGYVNVNPGAYNGICNATSAGKFYNSYIRGIYQGARVDDVEKRNYETTENTAETKFKIVAEVTGGVTIEVRADDIAGALKVAEEQINKAFEGDVKISFKGVNAV
jgi:hypothetical protein